MAAFRARHVRPDGAGQRIVNDHPRDYTAIYRCRVSGLHAWTVIRRPPPALAGVVSDGDFDSQPRRAYRRGMVSLLREIEDLFDALVVPWISPGAEEVSNGVEIHHLLKGESDFKSHHIQKRKVEDRIAIGHWASLPVFTPPASIAGDLKSGIRNGILSIGNVNPQTAKVPEIQTSLLLHSYIRS
jgi:hypothetical protein